MEVLHPLFLSFDPSQEPFWENSCLCLTFQFNVRWHSLDLLLSSFSVQVSTLLVFCPFLYFYGNAKTDFVYVSTCLSPPSGVHLYGNSKYISRPKFFYLLRQKHPYYGSSEITRDDPVKRWNLYKTGHSVHKDLVGKSKTQKDYVTGFVSKIK